MDLASSTPSLSKTSNPPLSSSTRLIPHQPQFMQTELPNTPRHHPHHHLPSNYERKLAKIQNNQMMEENLMPINFSSSSTSSTNSELEMKQRNRRKSSRILRGLTTALMSYPVLDPISQQQYHLHQQQQQQLLHQQKTPPPPPPPPTNSNYHLKWDDHLNSTVSAIQCLLATETFVDVTLVCDENEEDLDNGSSKERKGRGREDKLVNGNYANAYNAGRRDRRFSMGEEDEVDDSDEESGELQNLMKANSYQVKLKAHKVILSTCSEYFRKIFSENPCKHPVIVLKDFQEWEIRALLDFMYKGQLIVRPERLETLMKAADSLQIRGLRECIEKSEEWVGLKRMRRRDTGSGSGGGGGESDNEVESLEAKIRVLNRTSDNTKLIPATNTNTSQQQRIRKGGRSQVDNNESGPSSPKLLNLSMGGSPHLTPHSQINSNYEEGNGPQTSYQQQTAPVVPTHTNHQENPDATSPPFPRRKQARPRRRSGDFVAQDLRITVTPPPIPVAPSPQDLEALHNYHIHHNNNKVRDFGGEGRKGERPPHINQLISSHFLKNWPMSAIGSPIGTPPHPHSSPAKHELDFDEDSSSPPDRFRSPPLTPDSASPLFESKQFSGEAPLFNDQISGMGFKASPPSPSFFINLNNGHPLFGGHHSDSESNNPESAATPPSVFSPAGFPHNQGGGRDGGGGGGNHNSGSNLPQQWPGLPMGPAPIFGRHRAQHSAPRGGPPRAWSNADLTEALHNVWNKKMTTSQASRIFGIPYNSLLMYVRGKYGKSLKLDLLKKGLDLALENSNNGAGAGNPLNTNGNSISNNNNNNNNNNASTPPSTQKSSKSQNSSSSYAMNLEDSPPPGLTLSQQLHSHERDSGPDHILPSPFNPFSSIFGDYPPPFPFPPSALQHILPPVNHLSATDKINSIPSGLSNNRNRMDNDK